MGENTQALGWQPVAQLDRCQALDVLRGLALFGVLLVNLLGDFRVSLAEHILSFHTHPGWADRAVDVLVAALLEFKAFTLFSLLFGAGMAVFAERASARNVFATHFLVRRLLILFALGLCHLLLIWNGDILTLYAMCGLLLLPLLRLPPTGLAVAGVTAIAASFVLPWWWPSDATLHEMAAEASRVYAAGSMADVLAFHWRETAALILPLLGGSLVKTWGLMALGAAAWRHGIFREPERHRSLLWGITLVGGLVGGSATALSVYGTATGQPNEILPVVVEACSFTPLALAYGAGLLLALQSPAVAAISAPFAAVGQMALSNYLAQSVLLSWLFYGYGLGLFERIGPAVAALLGTLLYAGQVVFSQFWLRRFRFGPVEWLWRSLTYNCRQPLRRPTGSTRI